MCLVVFVNDRATNRAIYSQLARSIGQDVEVRAFGDPEEALNWLAANRASLIVTDYDMPRIVGDEFISRFHSQPHSAGVPIMMVKVCDRRQLRLRAQESGATDFLQVPVDHFEFLTRGRNLLKLSRSVAAEAATATTPLAEARPVAASGQGDVLDDATRGLLERGAPDIAELFGGSGLVLAIVRRRIEARGGRIGVESTGKGSLFWLELAVGPDRAARSGTEPLAVARAARLASLSAGEGTQRREPVCVVADEPFDALDLARRFAICMVAPEGDSDQIARAQRGTMRLTALVNGTSTAAAVEANAPRLAGRRILLAEDNGVNRRILAAILTAGGHRVTSVKDGHAALDLMLNEPFDLILLGLNLPKIGGLDAARLYRFGVPDSVRAPVLALTADASPERQAECAEAGLAACLTKPIAPEALLSAIDDALREAEAQFARSPDGGHAPVHSSPHRPDAIVTPEAFDALAQLGGEDFLRDLIAQFIEDGAQIAERMACAVEQGDLAAFRREAHALESSAGNVGAEALARLCLSWRTAAPEAFALYGDDYLDDLRGEWKRSTRALNECLARRSESPAGAKPRRDAAA